MFGKIRILGVVLLFSLPLLASLPNGGFESWTGGTPDYWAPDDSISVEQVSDTVHGGLYSAKVTLLTQSQSLADFIHDTVSVSENTMYILTAWIYDNDDAGRGRLLVRWYDASLNYITTSYGGYSEDQDTWQEMTFEVTSPSGAAYAKPGIRFYDIASNWDGDAVFHIDDFDLTPASQGPETLTIYEIQGQTSESPYVGDMVVTYGIVTGVFGNNFFVEENPGGAWHGIYVYRGSETDPVVQRGDSLRITGTVSEYYGMTELTNPTVEVLASGVGVPGPTVLPTGDVSQEDFEGVLIRVENAVCTNPDLGYGEWEVDDGSGPVRVDDMGYPFTPDSGAVYMVTGPVMYSYGNFKIEPRDEEDVYEYPTGIEEKGKLNDMSVEVYQIGKRVRFIFSRAVEKGCLSVYDASGRSVAGPIQFSSATKKIELSVSTPGVYFYRLELSTSSLKGKFIFVR